MTFRQYIKFNIQLVQILTVSFIVIFFLIKNKINTQAPIHFKITQQFLSDIAPSAMLICSFLGICHYFANQKLDFSLAKSKLKINQKIFGLTFLLGCSNLLLFLKTERLNLTQLERYIVLLLGLSSAGGISCISLNSLGIPIYQILIASIILPTAFIIIFIPLSTRKFSSSIKAQNKKAHIKF
ncbi:MAG: hypothetical protein ACRDD9_24375 [Shewanella sp.]